MKWLEANAYIAAWLSPGIALIGIILQNRSGTGKPVEWHRVMLYIGFLTCLAAVFTPQLELNARYFAGAVVASLIGAFTIRG
jgi:hypothetical protein